MKGIARNLVATVKKMVPGNFEVSPATSVTHPHVDWQAYRAVREQATALGLRHLGDVDVTSVAVDASMSNRPVLAIYVNQDGTEVIGHYRMPLRWTLKGLLARSMGGRGDFFDAGTIFGGPDQGVTLATTSAQSADVWTSPDFVLRDTLSAGSPLEQVLRRHRERVADYRRRQPDPSPIVARTLQDVVEASGKTERRKRSWREARGWATREELAAVSKTSGDTLNQLYAAFQEAAKSDSVAPASGPDAAPQAAPAPAAAVEALQFDRVDEGATRPAAQNAHAAKLTCAACFNPIVTAYYDVNGRSVCESCKENAVRSNQPARGAGVFFKSLLFGGVAAVVGAAIYYAVIAITEFEIGLVAILIGFMVGAAVRTGTAGRGGRKFQVMALVLTYFAVGLAYTPVAIKGAMNASSDSTAADSLDAAGDSSSAIAPIAGLSTTVPPGATTADSSRVTLAGDAAEDTTDGAAPGSATAPLSIGGALLGLGVVFIGGFLMVFALPAFAVVASMPSGLISALIIGFGMHQAWKMTAAQVHTISGPYRVGDDRSGAPAGSPPTA